MNSVNVVKKFYDFGEDAQKYSVILFSVFLCTGIFVFTYFRFNLVSSQNKLCNSYVKVKI